MDEMIDVTSSFGTDEPVEISGLDFSKAEKLDCGGSLCDAFRVNVNGRNYFVKKLKRRFQGKPFYRAALAKEYEIGKTLTHSSLPAYRAVAEDYIMLDFVKGSTLSEMIRRQDPKLRDIRFINRLLLGLIDVIGYLHAHNIVHCDIKPDNIIIRDSTGNPVLLDLDKCYTDAMASTSGDPTLYGVETTKAGSKDIDYHGLGMIVDRMRREVAGFPGRKYRRFVSRCLEENVEPEEIYSCITGKKNWKGAAIGIGLAMTAIALLLIFLPERVRVAEPNVEAVSSDISSPAAQTVDTVVPAPPPAPQVAATEEFPRQTAAMEKAKPITEKAKPMEAADPPAVPNPVEGSGEFETLMQGSFSTLVQIILTVENMETNPDIVLPKEKYEEYIARIDNELASSDKYIRNKIIRHYPDLSEKEISTMIENSPYYKKIMTTAAQKRKLLLKWRDAQTPFQ